MGRKWLDNYGQEENYNDSKISIPSGFVGQGYDISGRNYSPAWGGQFETGGSLQENSNITNSIDISIFPIKKIAQNGRNLKRLLNENIKTDSNINLNYTQKRNIDPIRKIKKDVDIIQTIQKKNNVSRKKALEIIQKEEFYKNISRNPQRVAEISIPEDQSIASKTWEVLTNPVTAASYWLNDQRIPDRFSKGERNNLDIATDLFNPFGIVDSAKNAVKEIISLPKNLYNGEYGEAGSNFLNAGLNTLSVIPALRELKGVKSNQVKKVLSDATEYITTNTPLKNTYKYNPWAFKPNPESYYRTLGKEGIDDAFDSGVIRPKQYHSRYSPEIGQRITVNKPEFPEGSYFNKSGLYSNNKVYNPEYIAEVVGKDELFTYPERIVFNENIRVAPKDIPIEQANFYKKDWLQGYKPIEVPKHSYNLENARPSLVDDFSKSFGLLGRSAKRFAKTLPIKLLPGHSNRAEKALELGNNWNRDWYNNPITQDRLNNMINHSNFLERIDWKNMQEAIKDEVYISHFQSNLGKIGRFLNSKPHFHDDNFGFSIRGLKESLDPIASLNKNGTQSFVDKYLPPSRIKSTAIHEGNHNVYNSDSFSGTIFSSMLNKNPQKPLGNISADKLAKHDEYLSIPEEIYARIQEIRAENKLVPGELLTDKMVDEIFNKGLSGKSNVDSRFYQLIDKDKFKKVVNVVPAVGAVGIGALQQKKNGGVIKDNTGYWNPENWGKVVEIDSNDITMKGVNQPLLGISDEGDIQYMEPNKDYKFKGKKVTEYPIAQKGKSIKYSKLPYDVKDIKNFYDNMLSSPWYKERLINNGYGIFNPSLSYPETVVARTFTSNDKMEKEVEKIMSSRRKSIRNLPVYNNDYDSTSYYHDPNINYKEVNLNNDQLNSLKIHPRSALVHEIGHGEIDGHVENNSALSGYERELIKQNQQDHNTDQGKYVQTPEEAKGDINSIRYNLYKAGKFDVKTGKYKTNDGKFDKTMITPIKDDTLLKRMLDAYGEEGLMELMNKIAQNNNQDFIPIARNGINNLDENSLQQLDQLTNFTNYNKLSNGGWLDKF